MKPLTLQELQIAIEDKPLRSALPDALDSELLHQITRDLRLCELVFTGQDEFEPPIKCVMYLVFHLLTHSAEDAGSGTSVNVSQEELAHWLQRYMHYAEREIVSRVVGVENKSDADDFLSELNERLVAHPST
jgi:hypothetical protein